MLGLDCNTICIRDMDVDSDRRRLDAFEMWRWRRMEKSSWLDTEEVLRRVNKDTQILNCIWQNTYLALVFGKGNIDGMAMF